MGEMTANVLIVDDDPSIRLLFRRAFEREGADVEEAEDGDDGIDAAVRGLPDLVVLDVAMPRRDGLSVLPELRSRRPQASVLIVTAFGNPETFDEARRLGAAKCFNKWDFLGEIPAVLEERRVN